ncbi:MAG: GtrA family protein [Lachnospiraceae bacterium]|nr:GtrA family protein [Lachnospiraceae bacterium]
MQFVKFGIIGVINTVLSYLINVFVLLVLAPYNVEWDFVAGNMVAFIITVFISFLLNGHFVFKKEEGETRSFWKTLLRTYIAYGFTGIILTNVLSFIWINLLGVSKFIAPLINLIASVPLNFIINKLWAFKGEK